MTEIFSGMREVSPDPLEELRNRSNFGQCAMASIREFDNLGANPSRESRLGLFLVLTAHSNPNVTDQELINYTAQSFKVSASIATDALWLKLASGEIEYRDGATRHVVPVHRVCHTST